MKLPAIQVVVMLVFCVFSMTSQPALASDAATYVSQAQQAFRLGQLQKAEQYYHLSLRATPNQREAMLGLSKVYLIQRRYEKGLEIIDQLLEQSPADATLLVEKGLLLRSNGQLAEAETIYIQAEDIGVDDPEILQRVAGFYMFIGKQAKALAISARRDKILKEMNNE